MIAIRHGARCGICAFSMAEVVISVALCVVIGLPLLVLTFVNDHETVTTEDYLFAEALAQRYLAEALAIPLEDLRKNLPSDVRIEGPDEEARERTSGHPAYVRNLEGPHAFRGVVRVSRVEDGLFAYTVAIEWPLRPGSAAKRRYAVLRFRSLYTISASKTFSQEKSQGQRSQLRGVDRG